MDNTSLMPRTEVTRNTSKSRRRSAPRKSSRRRTSPVVVAVGILAFAIAIRFVFPYFSAAVGDKVASIFDYRAAFAVLGEGISGEREFNDAVGEAWAAAFGEVEEEITMPTPIPTTVPVPDEAPTIGEAYEVSQADITPEVEPEETENAEETLRESMIAAFRDAQREYSDYMMPSGVTYDMPILPVSGTMPTDGVISSRFGYREHPNDAMVRFHYGIDIAADKGTPILAFADGTVEVTGESSTLGKYIIISHGDADAVTTYAHCGEVLFSSGQAVAAGEVIASVSNTGNATGNCLHFELKIGGVNVNPEYYLA